MSGVDSLPPYLEAIRIDPSYAPRLRARSADRPRPGERGAGPRARRPGAAARLSGCAAVGGALRIVPARGRSGSRAAGARVRAGGGSGPRRQRLPGAGEPLLAHRRPGARRFAAAARAGDLLARLARLPDRGAGPHGWRPRGRASAFALAARDSNAAVGVLVDWGNAEYECGHLDMAEQAYRRALRQQPLRGRGAERAGSGAARARRSRQRCRNLRAPGRPAPARCGGPLQPGGNEPRGGVASPTWRPCRQLAAGGRRGVRRVHRSGLPHFRSAAAARRHPPAARAGSASGRRGTSTPARSGPGVGRPARGRTRGAGRRPASRCGGGVGAGISGGQPGAGRPGGAGQGLPAAGDAAVRRCPCCSAPTSATPRSGGPP